MPARVLDGVAIARGIRDEVARDVRALRARGIVPGLAVVLVGDDPASAVYVRAKGRACDEAGMASTTLRLPVHTSEMELLAHLDRLNDDPAVHGILVQMPLPKGIKPATVIRRIHPAKDVDGFHPFNVGQLLIGDPDGFAPCTPAGVQEMLVRSGVNTRGMRCVILGRSNIVGKPMASLLIQDRAGANATVTVCHRHTQDIEAIARGADLLIAAMGRPQVVTGDWVKEGAVVIDVGINRVADASRKSGYRLVGDVHFESAREKASLITPVPGGVGPMTIAMLLRNTVRAATQGAVT